MVTHKGIRRSLEYENVQISNFVSEGLRKLLVFVSDIENKTSISLYKHTYIFFAR